MTDITLEVLTSPGCIHCDDFLAFWETISGEWPNVTLSELSIGTTEGQALARKHQIFASPGVILGGELIASGGINKAKFIEKLRVLSA